LSFARGGKAAAQDIGGMIYFDFIRRYERYGDITERRIFVPYAGIGVAGGAYEFIGGDDGTFVAPRAGIGFNVALGSLWGLDLRYQYSMIISNHFGWESGGKARHLNDVILSMRCGF
jgi:opacity protein-like surface antigen